MRATTHSWLHLGISLAALLVFLRSASAQVTVRAGAWSDGSIWSTGQPPVGGSSVVIAHPVTIHTDIAVGHSPASGSELVLRVTSPGSLTIQPSVTMALRGNAALDNAPLTLLEGASLLFDSSQSASPAQTRYYLQIGTSSYQESAILHLQGTERSPVVIATLPGMPGGYITGAGLRGAGLIDGVNAEFRSIGDESTPAISAGITGRSSFRLLRTRFISSGAFQTNQHLDPESTLILKNVSFIDTKASVSARINALYPKGGGTRELNGVVFDKPVELDPARDFTITNSIFLAGYNITEGPWAEFSGNLIRSPRATEHRIAADITDNYWLMNDPNFVNPHFVQALSYPADMAIVGNIFEFEGRDAHGDCILVGEPPSAAVVTIRNNIVLPNANGENSCTLFSALGNENSSILAEHNTYFVGSQGAAVGETYRGRPNFLLAFRSNLAWDFSPRGFVLFDSGVNDSVPDLIAAQTLDFNAGFNVLRGSSGDGYHNLEFSSGTPGVHDRSDDPEFADPKRRIARWDLSLGGTGTSEGALVALSKLNDAGFDPRYSVSALMEYVRGGFTPKNKRYASSAHDGTTIGAVSVIPPSETPGVTYTPGPVTDDWLGEWSKSVPKPKITKRGRSLEIKLKATGRGPRTYYVVVIDAATGGWFQRRFKIEKRQGRVVIKRMAPGRYRVCTLLHSAGAVTHSSYERVAVRPPRRR